MPRSEEPRHWRIVELSGSPYERGFQHGKLLGDEIRALYTMLLATSILPFLNRERRDVSSVLTVYKDDEIYGPDERGIDKFSYQIQLQSARHLQELLEPHYPEFFEELRGISDGSGVDYDKILILNTFVDTMLAFRAITFFIRQIQGPRLLEVEFISPTINSDGVDNNGDGLVDDGKDGWVRDRRVVDRAWTWVDEYGPSQHAAMIEVPTDATVRYLLEDQQPLTAFLPELPQEPQGMDADSVRVHLDGVLYRSVHDPDVVRTRFNERTCTDDGRACGLDHFLRVDVVPPGGLPAAAVSTLSIEAGNASRIEWPTPVHARNMREQRITFTTRGRGVAREDVLNRTAGDGRSQPPALGFGVRGSATPDGRIRLAHNFALLDANAAHKYPVLFVHHPDQGKDHAVLGWAGTIAGFSGINEDGLTYMVNTADTLDNAMTRQVTQGLTDIDSVRMVSEGVPVFMMGRRMLSTRSTVAEAQQYLKHEVCSRNGDALGATYGWNVMLGDAGRDLAVVEMDTNLEDRPDRGYFTYAPGEGVGSSGPDDLRFGSHYQANTQDVDMSFWLLKTIWIQPQRYWSTFWPRAVGADARLAEALAAFNGRLGTREAKQILAVPELHDVRDGMNAVVFEPECRRLHFAAGEVPPTDGDFVTYDLVPGMCAP